MRPQVLDPVEKKFVKRTWADVRVGNVITVFKVRCAPSKAAGQ
jgi:hypothetical protein